MNKQTFFIIAACVAVSWPAVRAVGVVVAGVVRLLTPGLVV